MVDHIVKIAGLLALPDLESETKQAINQYIRDGLKEPVNKQPQTPISRDDMLGLVGEWLNGAKGGDSG